MSAITRKTLNCVLRRWYLRQTQDVSNNFDDIPGPILFYGNEICGGMWRFWTILYVQKPNRFLVREHDFGGTNLRVFHVRCLVGKLKPPMAYSMLSQLKKLAIFHHLESLILSNTMWILLICPLLPSDIFVLQQELLLRYDKSLETIVGTLL